MSSVELVDNNYELVLEQGEGLSEKEVNAVEIHYDPNQSLEDLLNDFASEGKFWSIT
jgi:hypothetical protein